MLKSEKTTRGGKFKLRSGLVGKTVRSVAALKVENYHKYRLINRPKT